MRGFRVVYYAPLVFVHHIDGVAPFGGYPCKGIALMGNCTGKAACHLLYEIIRCAVTECGGKGYGVYEHTDGIGKAHIGTAV